MEFLRRLRIGSAEKEDGSDFIERLKTQKEEAQKRSAQIANKQRLRELTEQEEVNARMRERQQAEENGIERRSLRVLALQNSIVPGLFQQMAEVLDEPIHDHDDSLYIIHPTYRARDIDISKLNPTHHRTFGYKDVGYGLSVHTSAYFAIVASGIENGSVRIGKTTLNLQDAKDNQKVNKALEKAYKKPEIIVVHTLSERNSEEDWKT